MGVEMPASDAPTASPAEWSDAELLAEARSVASDLADMLEAEQVRRRAAELRAVRHFGTGWVAGACLGIPIGGCARGGRGGVVRMMQQEGRS